MSLNKNLKFLLATIYTFVNCIFVYKYGHRQTVITPILLALLYVGMIGLFFILQPRFTKLLTNKTRIGLIYWPLIFFCAVLFTYIISTLDPTNQNIDRWAALEISVETITHGLYPYTRIDYGGNMSSNFPSLAFIALPFYLMGDVGYLQIFTFLFFALFLYKTTRQKSNALWVMVLLLTSPALLWEVIVRSDLVSNILLFLIFASYWVKKYKKDTFQRPILLGVILAFSLLSRGILIIPVVLFFITDFLKSDVSTKTKFIISSIVTSFVICTPLIVTSPSWDTFINFNPLKLQTDKAPVFSYLFLLLVFIAPYKLASYIDRLFCVALIIFAIPFTSFISSIVYNGWQATIFDSLVDISYLSMSLAPILLWFKRHLELTEQSTKPSIP